MRVMELQEAWRTTVKAVTGVRSERPRFTLPGYLDLISCRAGIRPVS